MFKSNRADILKRGMSPDPVREALHILKDGLPKIYLIVFENEYCVIVLTVKIHKMFIH